MEFRLRSAGQQFNPNSGFLALGRLPAGGAMACAVVGGGVLERLGQAAISAGFQQNSEAFSEHDTVQFYPMKDKLTGKHTISPNHSRKLSEVLLEFAEEIAPVDELAPLADQQKVVANAVALAIMLWNTPFLPQALQAESVDRINQWLATSGRTDAKSKAEVERLLELRRTLYGTDRRMVMDYKLGHAAAGPELTVSSLDLDRPENRNFKV